MLWVEGAEQPSPLGWVPCPVWQGQGWPQVGLVRHWLLRGISQNLLPISWGQLNWQPRVACKADVAFLASDCDSVSKVFSYFWLSQQQPVFGHQTNWPPVVALRCFQSLCPARQKTGSRKKEICTV